MKKTLIAAAIAAASIGAAQAQQNVRLYGLTDMFVGQIKDSVAGSRQVVDSGGMTTSFWGFSGTEDLGGGLKAVMTLESFIRTDVGQTGRFPADGMFTRSAFIGLEGGFGRFTVGRNTTPYFLSTIIYNPFGDSFNFSPAVAHSYLNGYLLNDSGWNNSFAYSNRFGPVRASLLYSLGLERISTAANKQAGRAAGGSLDYGAGPLSLNLAMQQVEVPTGAPEAITKQTATLLSGAYLLGPARLTAQYQEIKNETGPASLKHKSYQLGASVKAGPGSVLASFGNVKTTDNNPLTADDKRDSWALGYDYFLSKRTDVYAAWYETKVDSTKVKVTAVGVGIRHRF
jgi:predicted porin